MSTATIIQGPSRIRCEAASDLPQWYAVSTRAHHEKAVVARLGAAGFEHFLPLYKSVRHWKDRSVTLGLPLFPGYVFLHVRLLEHQYVLRDPGVSRFVGFDGLPAVIDDDEIEAVRRCLADGSRPVPHPYLPVGRCVRITNGPFIGLQGVVLSHKGVSRVVISIHLLKRSLAIQMNMDMMREVD